MGVKCPKCNTDNPDTQKFCGECATPLPSSKEISVTKTLETPVEEFSRGTTLADRYEIIEELGKGGMGTVYKVEDKKIGQDIALKLIKQEIASDKKTIERFRNELKTTRMISHRNVCRMFDLGDAEGANFITMEYIPGEDLKNLIRRVKQIPEGTAISIAKQVCEGLAEAHRLGVVHRDLKSSNIMIDKEGNARVMDFGIARSIRAKGLTGEGIIIGTPEYMSPEQAEAKEVDHRSDIYSLGVILYEMLIGRLPFEGETPLAIAMKHKGESPQNPKDLKPQISDDLSQLILKCLSKAKEDRYQSADQVFSGLADIEKGIPTTQKDIVGKKPFTSKEITVTFTTKKWLIPAFIILAVAIVGLFLWHPWSPKETVSLPEDRSSLAILYFTDNTGDVELSSWKNSLPELLIDDLSQSKYIYILPKARLLDILIKFNLDNKYDYTHEDLRSIASWCGINHIITGGIYKSGGNIRVNITLQDANSGEVIGSDSSEAKGENILFRIADELTRKIKTLIKLPEDKMARDIDMAIGEITTGSPEAYKFFNEGTWLYFKVRFSEAIPLLENAVALDPAFAMAYRHLGTIHRNRGNRAKGDKYLQKSFELADQVSERERLSIQANYYYWQEDFDKALEKSKELLQLYPDDILGNRILGLTYLNGLEDPEAAAKQLEIAYRTYPENGIDCCNLAGVYTRLGLVHEAGEILDKHLQNFPDEPTVRRYFVQALINLKEYDAALTEWDRVFHMDPARYNNSLYKGDIYFISGQLLHAENEYKKVLEAENSSDQRDGLRRIALLHLSQGKYESSKKIIEEWIESATQHGAKGNEFSARRHQAYLFLRIGNFNNALSATQEAKKMAVERGSIGGIRLALIGEAEAYLGAHAVAEAERAAEELKNLIEKEGNKRDLRQYHRLKGLIEREKGNFKEAVKNIELAISLSNPFILRILQINDYITYLEPLAKTYFRIGDLEKAREEYGRIISHPTARRDYGDIYVKSFYMLGKIHEQQGNSAKAIDHYKKFLDLWKDADPGIAEVEDAKRRLHH